MRSERKQQTSSPAVCSEAPARRAGVEGLRGSGLRHAAWGSEEAGTTELRSGCKGEADGAVREPAKPSLDSREGLWDQSVTKDVGFCFSEGHSEKPLCWGVCLPVLHHDPV